MPSRRRRTSGKKLTATAGLTTVSEKKLVEETHPVVTQVIEVIEEEVPVEHMPVPPQDAPESEAAPVMPEETPGTEAPEKDAEPPMEEQVTRKERVEELYQQAKETSVMPEISVHKNKPVSSILVWAIVTIVVALLTGGILFAAAKKTSPMKLFARPTPTPTSTPTPTPTPTPAAVDKKTFEIKVLNGGGTPGAAGKMKTLLEDKGYTVSGTGNTEEYTYTTTEIHGKETMKDAIANIESDIKDAYTLGTVAADLPASASAAVEVIVGK